MDRALRAVVIGAGWAGEGHTKALRHHGVDVAAICARDATVVAAVAARLQIPEASTDWQATLRRVRPDVVTLATPATLRSEVVAIAAEMGCHMVCEKPLASAGVEAEAMYRLVQEAGIKHAYGACHRYDPSVAWLAELLRDGAIGRLQEVDGSFRGPARGGPLRPWTWVDSLAAGGGAMNLGFTHSLGMLEQITGRVPVRVVGEARVRRRRAPVVGVVHDLRDLRKGLVKSPTAEEAERLQWRECDAEFAYSASMIFATATATAADDTTASEILVRTLNGPGPEPAWPPNGWRFYGETGTLMAEGSFSLKVSRVASGGALEPLPVPERLTSRLPTVGDDGENKWAALIGDFLADVRGEPRGPYPTFLDGWRTQEVIDAIRAGRGWVDVPAAARGAAAAA